MRWPVSLRIPRMPCSIISKPLAPTRPACRRYPSAKGASTGRGVDKHAGFDEAEDLTSCNPIGPRRPGPAGQRGRRRGQRRTCPCIPVIAAGAPAGSTLQPVEGPPGSLPAGNRRWPAPGWHSASDGVGGAGRGGRFAGGSAGDGDMSTTCEMTGRFRRESYLGY